LSLSSTRRVMGHSSIEAYCGVVNKTKTAALSRRRLL
jgi:hypothetical protein